MFRFIFETPSEEGWLRHIVQPAEEAGRTVVMENRSGKDITGLRYRWVMTYQDTNTRNSLVSHDSYMIDVYRPVLKTGDRKLISPSASVDESSLKHFRQGGGGIGSGNSRRSLDGVNGLRFEIDLVLFEDGEIAGPDPNNYAGEIQWRKPAAEFVAKQIRLADREGRDPTPVLSALAEMPHLRDDFPAHWVRHYCGEFLHFGKERMREALLHHFENRPALPRFYRRQDGDK